MLKGFKKLSETKQLLFTLMIAFAVIAFWRGLWGLMDVYVFPNDYILSLWVTLLVGLLILVVTKYAAKELT